MPTSTSPLINGGVATLASAPSTDARGLARKVGAKFDIGAVEVRASSAPRFLEANLGARGTRKVDLNWTSPLRADSFTYVVQRRTGTGPWVTLTSTQSSSIRTYVARGLVAGKTYSFRVLTLNRNGLGLASGSVTKTAR
jgi:hypothetical protein